MIRLLSLVVSALLAAPTSPAHAADLMSVPYTTGVWMSLSGILPHVGTGMPLGAIVSISIINFVLWTIGGTAVAVIIWGAIRIISSAGEQDKIESGKKAIKFAVIGLALGILGYAILVYVINVVWWGVSSI